MENKVEAKAFLRNLTYKQIQKLLENQARVTENELLSPKDKSLPDEEMIEVVPLQAVLSLIYQLAEGDMVLIKDKKEDKDKEAGESLASDIYWILSTHKLGIESKDRTIILIEKVLDKYFDEVSNKGDDNNGK